MESQKGRFLRGTEQGYSGGSGKDCSGEEQRAHKQKRVNINRPEMTFPYEGMLAKLDLGCHLELDG